MALEPEQLHRLSRWVLASVAKALSERVPEVPILIQGIGPLEDKQKWGELFVNGPHHHHHTNNYTTCDVEILIGCQVRLSLEETYALQDVQGAFVAALKNEISVYKYGDNEELDDESYIGCLRLKDEPIDGILFGETKYRDIEVRRSTVEAKSYMELTL